MELGYAVLAVSFVIAFVVVNVLKPIAYWAELVDKPGGRKQHQGVVPLIGGIAIYTSVLFTTFLFIEQPLFIRLFLLAGGLIVFMGMVDDRYQLSARFRLVGQLLVSCIFVYGLEVHFGSFGDLIAIGELNPPTWMGYPLAVLSIMGAINAMNMLDGMDGLVGAIAMISFIGLVALFGASGDSTFQYLCMTFIGSTGAFLIFNLWGKPDRSIGKVFMGDAGSMFLGLSLGVLLIYGSQTQAGHAAAFSPTTALWFVLLPITDMFTIMYRRIRRGRSPMEPDRTHIHHILMRAGFSAKQTLYVMLAIQGLFVALGVYFYNSGGPEWVSFAAAIAFVVFYQFVMKRSWRFIRWSKRHLFAAA